MYNVLLSYQMKVDFDKEKNSLIQQKRGISFKEIGQAVHEGKLLAIVEHPNQVRYPRQKLLIVDIHDYACVVPFVEQNDVLFLKTAFFSRKYTKKYLKKGERQYEKEHA